jgi:glycosyltransferase involved in cell wall biosynthesis
MRICLITPHHISFQPRALREADALTAAGHDVRVVSRQVDSGLTGYDRQLEQTRKWRLQPVVLDRNGGSHRRWMIEAVRAKAFQKLFDVGVRNERVASRAYVRGLRAAVQVASSEESEWLIAHTHAALPIASAAAERWNAKLGFDCEDLLSELGADPPEIIELIEREYLSACDYISVPSESIGERLRERYNIRPPVVLYNVFPRELADGMLAPEDRAAVDALRLHWFGQTIGEGRGLEEAMQTMELIRGNVELHLRGRVSEEYRTHLQSIVRKSRHKVFFHPLVAHDELIKSLEQFDVGLALERPENSGYARTVTNKVFSYLLGGLAIAATDTPGQREVMENIPSAGFLYDAGNPASLADGLQRWLGDRNVLRAAQQAAWEAARERYCWDIEKQTLLKILKLSKSEAVAQTA